MGENKKDEKSVHSVLAKASTVHARLIVHAYVKASFSFNSTQYYTLQIIFARNSESCTEIHLNTYAKKT